MDHPGRTQRLPEHIRRHRVYRRRLGWGDAARAGSISIPMLSGAFPAIDVVRLFAIVFVAICLVPAGGHLAEIPNKTALPPGEYMIVQKIYRGWALFGVVVFGALAFTLVHTMMVWREPIPRGLSLQSFLALAGTQVIFWTCTYPMNALTQNWTVTPENLQIARQQWEYSHAVNALITFAALELLTLSVLLSRGHIPTATATA